MEYCKTNRGGEQLLYEGFRYQLNRRGANNRKFWRCHNRDCPGRLSTELEVVKSRTEHCHSPDLTSNNVHQLKSSLKKQCQTSVDTIPKLYNEMLVKVAEQNSHGLAANVPTFPSVKSALYRSRNKMIPQLPQSRENVSISEQWAETLGHQRFLLRCDGEGDDKIIILATDKMLERISTASTLFIDGTFATCPRLFYQLFTINIYIEEQQYPALYALLPAKSRNVYNRLFTIVKEEMQNRSMEFIPPRILTDFEIGLLQAVQLHFPTTSISGCYFHFHQCLYRWVLSNGHSILYREQGQFYNFVRAAAALAFVPVENVRIAWFALRSAAPVCEVSVAFRQYFTSTWMQGFPLPLWNHFTTTEDRTNNSLEGWHNRLNRLAGRDHPNIWQLLRILQKEEAVSEVKILQLQNGGLPVKKRATWQRLNCRIKRLKAKYETTGIHDYLERMSQLTGLLWELSYQGLLCLLKKFD